MTVGEVQFQLYYYDLVSVVAGWNVALVGATQLRGKSNFILQNNSKMFSSFQMFFVDLSLTVCILKCIYCE